MAIFRGALPADDFAIVANHWFRDPRLTGKAKGYMGYIATHSPKYRLTIEQLIAEMKEKRDAVYAGLEELVEFAYLVRTQARDGGGKMGEVDYHFGPAAYAQQYERAWVQKDKTPGQTASGKSGSGHDQGEQEETPGQTASGFSASGKTDSKKTNALKDHEKKNPPTPRTAEPSAPPVADAETGGDSSASPDNPNNAPAAASALDLLVVELAEAGHWSADVVREVLVELADRGRTPAEIARVFREVAAGQHGPTGSPRRLLSWWPTTTPAAPTEPYRHKPAPACVKGCDCWKHQVDAGQHPGISDNAVDALAALRAQLPKGQPLSRYTKTRPDAAAIPSRRRLAENAGDGANGAGPTEARGNDGTGASGEISTESGPASAAA